MNKNIQHTKCAQWMKSQSLPTREVLGVIFDTLFEEAVKQGYIQFLNGATVRWIVSAASIQHKQNKYFFRIEELGSYGRLRIKELGS